MLNQYFNTKANEHGTAEKFCFSFILCSKHASHLNTCRGNHKCCAAYNGYCKPDINFKKCKCYAYGKSIYAGCHCRHEHAHERKRLILIGAVIIE